MKKQSTQKPGTPAKKGAKTAESDQKKASTLKPIKSKEVKRSKNPSVFEDDDDFLDDDLGGLDDLSVEGLEDDEDDF